MAAGWGEFGRFDSYKKQEERRIKRMDRHKANQEAWATSRNNSRTVWREQQEALAKIPYHDHSDGSSASLTTLRKLIADDNLPIHRRIDAAETVLGYELGAASLAGADPDAPITAPSFKFLRDVAANLEVPEALRFRCLKSIAAIENNRASKANVGGQAGHKSLLVTLINAARRTELIKAGVFQQVIAKGEDWTISLSDDFDEPALPRSQTGAKIEGDGRGVGAVMHGLARREITQQTQHTHEALLGITAKNRADDWRRHIKGT